MRNRFWMVMFLSISFVAPASAEQLTALLPRCDQGGAIRCDNDVFKKVWSRVEALDGSAAQVDTDSVKRGRLGATAIVYGPYVPGTAFDPARLIEYSFDCAGHYQAMTSFGSPILDAPPRSMAGVIAAQVCR